MNIVKVEPQVDPSRFIVITRQTDIDETITNRVFVTDNINNSANIIEISRGIQGFTGPKGADGVVFDILPIISGGTNNSTFEAGKIIYYDGAKLISSEYDVANILTEGVLAGSGLIKVESNGNLTLNTNLGAGLYLDENKIAVNFDAIDDRILQQINVTAGSGLLFNSDTSTYHIGSSNDILVNNDNIELTPTGIAGTYSKVTTDNKGRVVSGSNLSSNEIESLLGYIPWRANNDGDNSGLDADKLDSYHASFFRNANNLTGLLNTNTIKIGDPNQTVTKLILDSNGAISSVSSLSDNDISQILGYVPANKNGDTLTGSFNINSSIFDPNGVKLNDNLPILAGNHYSLAYNDLRGFRFLYGGNPNLPKTGIFGYDYGSDQLKLIVEDTTHIILNQSIAHELYAALGSSNTFSGVNTFLTNTFAQHIYVTGLSISTTGLIQNLNSQYLNFKTSDYYTDASNLNGILNASGFPVVVSNISGSIGYIPLFDNRTSNPSRTIKDSIVSQDENIIKINNGNLFIGSSNSIESGVTDAAIIAGHNNNMSGTISGFIFGNSNLIGSDVINSTIIGNNAVSKHNNTVLLGQDGVTWSDNQTIFGMFKEPSTSDSADGQGQYTSIGLSYYGQASNYTNLEPNNKYIPKHKTILFNSDVIINRLAVSGTAVFRFESGVIRNVTKPIDGNALFAENQCFFLKEPVKKVIFNDTYIRDYLIYLDLEDNPSAQKFTNIKITDNTINSPFFTDVQNVDNNVIINPKPISLSGSFEWQEHPHTLNLYLDKPLVSGYYYIDDTDAYLIDIYTYDHQAITGSTLDIKFNSNIIPDGRYIVQSIIDNHKLKVYKPFDKAIVSSFVDNGSSYDIDLQFETPFTDYYSNSSKIYLKYLNTNFDISDLYSNVSYTINQNIVTASLTNLNKNSFLINDLPFPTGCVEVLPVLTNMSGYCFVNPKSNFVQTFDYMLAKTTNVNNIPVPLYDTGENYISSSLYRPSKAFYRQEPSDADGYSKITISGINFSNDPEELAEKYRLGLNPWFQLKGNTSYKDQDFYNLWGHVDGGAFHIAKSSGVSFYAKFANYINANYLYVHDYYEYLSGILPGEASYFDGHPIVSGFVLDIKHLDLKGDTSVSGLSLLPSEGIDFTPDVDIPLSNIFIDKINSQSVGIYANTSGYRYYSEGAPSLITKTADLPLFIPYSLGDLSVSGTMRIVESGSYKSGNHPLNKNIYPFNIVYNENKPVYFPQTASYLLAGDPEFSFVTYIKYDHPNSGHAVSGYVDVYATPIAVEEKISFSLDNITTNRNMLGSTIDLTNNGSFDIKRGFEYRAGGILTPILIIEREFFYPTEYVSNFSGLVSIDRNHNLKVGSSSEYSYIPVVFDNNNYFDNAIFEITTIDDNKITLDNSKNILRYNPNKKFNRDNQYRVSYSSGVNGFSGTVESPYPANGFFFDLFEDCDRGIFDNKNHLDQNDKIKIIDYLPTGYNSAQQVNQIFEVYNDSVTTFFYPNTGLPYSSPQDTIEEVVATKIQVPNSSEDSVFFDIRFACNQNHSSSNFVFPTGFQGTYGKFYVVDINGCDQSQYLLEATTIDSPLYLNAGDLMSIGPVVENQPYYLTISGYLWNTTPRIDPYFEKTFTFTFSGNYDPSYRDLYITQPLLIDNKYANSSTDSHSLGYIYVAKSGDDDGPLGPGYTPQYNFIFSNIYGSNNNDEFKISNDKQLLYTKTFEYDTIDLSNNIKYVEILAQHTNIPSDRFVKKFGISGILAPNYLYRNLGDSSTRITEGIGLIDPCIIDVARLSVDDKLIVENDTPTKDLNVFSTKNHDTPTYIRNTNFWGYDIDFTSVSPWNSSGIDRRAGTLISPRHVMFATHYHIGGDGSAAWNNVSPENPETIRFVNNNNAVVERNIIALTGLAVAGNVYPDITIGYLDAPITFDNDGINFAKILPPYGTDVGNQKTISDILPIWANGTVDGITLANTNNIPVVIFDQEEKAFLWTLLFFRTYDVGLPQEVLFSPIAAIPGYPDPNSVRISYEENIVDGDSGDPVFIIINNIPILITVLTGAGRGTDISYFKDEIDTLMYNLSSENGAGGNELYQLSIYNLSNFNDCSSDPIFYQDSSLAILEQTYLLEDKYLQVLYRNYQTTDVAHTTITPYAVLDSGSDYYMGSWYNTTGLISWTHYASGNCYIPQNLIPFNTDINYQNFYNRWGLNSTGLLVKDLVSSSKYEMSVAAGCEPDAVCIKIENISSDAYDALSENDKVYLSFDYPNEALSSGFIVNQKDNSESKNSLYLRPRKSSLATAVVDHCGYVTVTPFYDTNAITNKNPNYNGSFINPNINSLNTITDATNLLGAITGYHLTLFDNFTNRYIHNIEIQNTGIYINNKGLVISDVPDITGYNLRLSTLNQNNFSAKKFHILCNSRDPISISSISYRYADPLDGWKPNSSYNYNVAEFEECTTSLSLYNNTPFELQIKTEYGTYSDSPLAAPQISIFGVREYSVTNKTFVKYDESTNQGYWLLTVRCQPFTLTDNRNITVFVKDTSGYDSKSLSITISPRLVVKDATQIFSDGKIIHIYGVSSTDNIANLGISGTSYDPSLLLWDSILQAWTVKLDAYNSIDVTYLGQIQTIQAEPTTLTNSYIRITNLIDPSDPIVFKTNCNNYIIDVLYLAPPDLIGEPNLSVTGSATVVSTSYSSSFSGRKYIFRVTLNKEIMTNGIYSCMITINQNSLATSIQKNIVISLPLFVDTGYLFQPIKINDTSPWIVDFKINSASGYLPSITLSNTPSFTYKLGTVYSSGLDQYQVTATGYKDYLFDDQYFTSYGVKNLLIYIDDKYSYNSGTIRLDLTKYNDIYNLQPETYAFYNKTTNIILDTDYIDKDITKNNDISDIQTVFTFDKKYNPNYNQYSHKIITTPIDYIYDAVVEIENEQFLAPLENIFVSDALDDDYSVYKLNLKAKGILNDRIYSVGKIDTLEVKNDFKIIKPLEISNIEPDPLSTSSLQGGAKWTLKFNVCYGIAQEEYRPLIVLSGMPTSCTGLLSEYVEPDTPSLCYKNSEFNNSTKCWTFEFEGVPNCDLNNIIFPIVIKAYDTFDNGSTVVDSDTKTTTIRYGQLPTNPPPTLTIESTSSNVYPNCSFVSYPWSGLVGTRSVCPVITGLYRLSLFGYLPSGLNINFDSIIDFDGNSTTPSIGNHYLLDTGNGIHDYGSGFYYTATIIPDNISGIVGTINGTITEFFEGTKTLSGILTNRIDDTTATEVSFLDNSNALTNPVQYGVLFFDSDQPVSIEENNGISTNGIRTIVNPPDALSLQKHGRFHEQNGFYSGVYSTFDQDNAILSISGINRPVSQNNLVLYSPFTPDLYYDSVYIDLGSSKVLAPIAEWVSPNSIKIVAQRSFVNPNSPLPCSFVIPKIADRLGNFNGPLPDLSINSDTNGDLLGCGTYASDGSTGKIYGKLRPAYRGYIYNSGVQIPYPIRDNERIDQLFNTISVEGIDGVCCDSAQSSVYLTNCYETGIIKISGIVVPKPVVEWTDIPDLLYKSNTQALAIRIAYGYDKTQRSFDDNNRNIDNPISGTLIKISGLDESQYSQFTYNVPITITIQENVGYIFKLNLRSPESESFPTTNQYAIPSLTNDQYFSYVGLINEPNALSLTSNSRSHFPSFVPIIDTYLGISSGQSVNGFIMGGFRPATAYSVSDPEISDSFVQDTTLYTEYPPKISGILSSGYYNQYDGIYSINQGIILAYTNNIDINNIATGVGDYLAIFSPPLTTGILVEGTGMYEFDGDYRVGVSGNTLDSIIIDNSGCLIQKCVVYELDSANSKIILDKPYQEINIQDQINLKPLNNYDSQNIIGITGTITAQQINGNKLICDTNAYDLLSEYYDISGFATVDRILSSSGLATILSSNSPEKLLWTVLVSGVSGESLSHLDKDYKYHLISQDNPDMPVFDALSWPVTHGARTYPLHMIKNLEIYSIGDTNNPATVLYRTYSGITWSVSFYVANGKRPLRNNYPYIDLKNSCNFTYSISYNDVLDMLLVEASSTDTQATPCIRVYNDLGHSTEINVS